MKQKTLLEAFDGDEDKLYDAIFSMKKGEALRVSRKGNPTKYTMHPEQLKYLRVAFGYEKLPSSTT